MEPSCRASYCGSFVIYNALLSFILLALLEFNTATGVPTVAIHYEYKNIFLVLS